MSGAIFFSFLASLLICMALIPVLTVTAGRLHILDKAAQMGGNHPGGDTPHDPHRGVRTIYQPRAQRAAAIATFDLADLSYRVQQTGSRFVHPLSGGGRLCAGQAEEG